MFQGNSFKNLFAGALAVCPLVLLLAGAAGLFGGNVQELVSDLCLTFTSHRVIVYQR